MSDTPSDSNGDSPRELQEEVQDYLDMLLTRATEPPAQVSHIADQQEEQYPRRRSTDQRESRSLTMIGGTAVCSIDTAPVPEFRERPRPVPPKPYAPRPYAEPTRPLTLKLPLAEVKVRPQPEIIEPPPAPEPPPITVEAPSPVQTPAPTPEESTPEPPVPVATPEPELDTPTLTSSPTPEAGAWLDNGRPAWAQERFQCLLFTVGGLTLAVPLVELGTIYPLSEELTPLFGQVEWFMGLLPIRDNHNVKTVDTARVVMPERYQPEMVENYRYVITLDGVDWGLAVDQVSTAKTLHPDEVRWRSERSKRPWLAGTVVEHMCALLDVGQLVQMFQRQVRLR